jgi:hypothetical protein
MQPRVPRGPEVIETLIGMTVGSQALCAAWSEEKPVPPSPAGGALCSTPPIFDPSAEG